MKKRKRLRFMAMFLAMIMMLSSQSMVMAEGVSGNDIDSSDENDLVSEDILEPEYSIANNKITDTAKANEIIEKVSEQVFPSNLTLAEVQAYLKHFIFNSKYAAIGGQAWAYPNEGASTTVVTDGVYTMNTTACKGCYAYSKWISNTIYGKHGNHLDLGSASTAYTADSVKSFLKKYAQAGEHLCIGENTHSITVVYCDDNGMYYLDYETSHNAMRYSTYKNMAEKFKGYAVFLYNANTKENDYNTITDPELYNLIISASKARGKLSVGSVEGAIITSKEDLYIMGSFPVGNSVWSLIPRKWMDNVVYVSLGEGVHALIKEDGSLYTWGYNYNGKIGNGDTTKQRYDEPTKIMDNVETVDISDIGAAVTKDGDLYIWGDGAGWYFGDGSSSHRYKPVKLMGNVATVSVGGSEVAVITKDGSLYVWEEDGRSDKVKAVKIMNNVVSVSTACSAYAAITKDGSLYTWGYNGQGELGNGTLLDTNVPEKIMDNVSSVSFGRFGSCAAVTEDGDLYTWGDNVFGELGNGKVDESRYKSRNPIPIKILNNVASVSMGEYSGVAITKDGSIYEWGKWLGVGQNLVPTKISIPTIDASDDEETITLPQGPDTWQSKSGVEGYVYRIYNVAMLREPDAGGADYWANQLNTKAETASDVARGFFFSDEFKQNNYSDAQYVSLLYRTIFGRDDTGDGLNYWLGLMKNGMSREYVFKGFAESPEFTMLCNTYGVERGNVVLTTYRDQNEGATGFIARLYTEMMARPYDEGGLEYWCEMYLTNTMSIESIVFDGFTHSAEFTNLNLDDEEYVKRTYKTLLNREAEGDGLKYWVDELKSGRETRDSIVYGFAASKEFSALKASYGL